MNIIGLDLSLAATGVATNTGHHIIRTLPADILERRLVNIRESIWKLLNPVEVADGQVLAVIEDLPKHVAHGGTQLGMVHGQIRPFLWQAGVPFVLIPPASLKKYATGKGNAGKADIRMEVYKRFDLDITDDNEADAFVLRAMGLDAYGQALVPMPQSHRVALEAVTWPTMEAAVA